MTSDCKLLDLELVPQLPEVSCNSAAPSQGPTTDKLELMAR